MLLNLKFVFLALLAASSTAFPNPPLDVHTGAFIQARELPANYKEEVKTAVTKYGGNPEKTLMYSGIGPKNARKFAEKHHLQTVEMTIDKALAGDAKKYDPVFKKYFVELKEFEKNGGVAEDWHAAWTIISETWAGYARISTTLVVKKGGLDAESYFKRVEERILIENQVRIITKTYDDLDQ